MLLRAWAITVASTATGRRSSPYSSRLSKCFVSDAPPAATPSTLCHSARANSMRYGLSSRAGSPSIRYAFRYSYSASGSPRFSISRSRRRAATRGTQRAVELAHVGVLRRGAERPSLEQPPSHAPRSALRLVLLAPRPARRGRRPAVAAAWPTTRHVRPAGPPCRRTQRCRRPRRRRSRLRRAADREHDDADDGDEGECRVRAELRTRPSAARPGG